MEGFTLTVVKTQNYILYVSEEVILIYHQVLTLQVVTFNAFYVIK